MHGRIDKVIEGGGRETGRRHLLDPRLLVAYCIRRHYPSLGLWSAASCAPALTGSYQDVWCLVLCKSWTICAIKFSHTNRPSSLPSAAPRHTASSALVCSLKIVGDLLDFASCPDTGCCCCWSLAWHQLLDLATNHRDVFTITEREGRYKGHFLVERGYYRFHI